MNTLEYVASSLLLRDERRLAYRTLLLAEELEKKPQRDKRIDPSQIPPEDLSGISVEVSVACSMLIEAGLKDDFFKLMDKGKNALKKAWENVKDKALQAQIKALDSVGKVKQFIIDHPELKWALVAAIVLGVLVFPSDAFAQIFDAKTNQELAKGMNWQFTQYASGGYKSHIGLSHDWIKDVFIRSMADSGSPTEGLNHFDQNLIHIIQEKGRQLGMQLNSAGFKDLAHDTIRMIYDAASKEFPGLLQRALGL